MAADGGSYGHYVIGRDPKTKDILVRSFTASGWGDEYDIDWFKLQYRYQLTYTRKGVVYYH